MKRPLLLALVALAASAGIIESASARDYDSRRQDRREAIVAGAVRNKVATDRAEERYRECIRESRYDEDCDRRLWEEEQEAKRKGRRTAIIVGAH
jgi:hypothetical protein